MERLASSHMDDGSHDDELGGAWPFVVGGVICQINFGNEHDSHLLTRT